MAFSWIGRTTSLASVVRNENSFQSRSSRARRFWPGCSARRSPRHGRQMPAKVATSTPAMANQVESRTGSAKAVKGTRAAIGAGGEPFAVHVAPPFALEVADVGDRRFLAGDRRKAPARHDELEAAGSEVRDDDWRVLVGVDVRLRRQVARSGRRGERAA